MHKNYFERGHNNILKFFPDRIQIENIWLKPRSFVLGKTVFRRNHLLADLLNRIHFGEKMGSGMKRMKNICKQENAPYPRINYTDTHFYIMFKQSKEYLKMAPAQMIDEEGKAESSEKSSEKILRLLKENNNISAQELAELIGISSRAVEKHLAKLKELNRIKRVGPDKGGHWEVYD